MVNAPGNAHSQRCRMHWALPEKEITLKYPQYMNFTICTNLIALLDSMIERTLIIFLPRCAMKDSNRSLRKGFRNGNFSWEVIIFVLISEGHIEIML